MANVTVTSAQYFIPEIWAQRALQVLRSNIVLAKLVTKDTDVATFQVGDVLHIPAVGAMSANLKSANSGVTLQVPTDSEATVTLNKHYEASFLVEDPVRAQANQSVMDRYINSAVMALAEQIETHLFALYSGFSQSAGTSGANLDTSAILAARKKLNDSKVPQMDRHLVISTKDEIALLADSDLSNYFAYNRVGIPDGAIGRLYGFTLWTSQLVPVVSGSPDSTKNLAFHPEAMILAMRGLPDPPDGSGAKAATIRDPESGLVLRVLQAYNPTYLGVQVTIDVLYGVAEMRDACGVVVLS